VGSTMQITSAMKMVSAAKLKRATDAIERMRPYAVKLQALLSNVSASLDNSENVYAQAGEGNKTLFVAIASNRGLAGAFNNNIIKAYSEYNSANDEELSVLSIGKRMDDNFRKGSNSVTEAFGVDAKGIFDNLNFNNVSEIAQKVMDAFVAGDYNKVVIGYNSFKNAATQIVKTEQLLPIIPPSGEENDTTSVEYIFNPSKEEIVSDLIPKSLKIHLYKAILDSHASEHGARMTAMHKATDNASELRDALKLTYNKARQAAITNEILEIVGGAEALNS